MKKIISAVAVIMSLLMILPTFAAAADTGVELKVLYLGTAKVGEEELSDVPSNGEVVVNIIRYLGKELYVRENAMSYLLYLESIGIIDAAEKFNANAACTFKEFADYMLRILGYVDFKDEQIIDFAVALDIITPDNCKELFENGMDVNSFKFTRDTMFRVLHTVLSLMTADERYEMLVRKFEYEETVSGDFANAVFKEVKDKRYKLAFVGDSLTWSGCCTNQDKNSYPALVAKWLGTNFDWENCGQGGATYAFSTVNHPYEYVNVPAFKKGIIYEPDLVLIMFGTNDAAYLGSGSKDILKKDMTYLIKQYQKLSSKPYIVINTAPSCPQLRDTIKSHTNPTITANAKSLGLDCINTFNATNNASLSYDGVHFVDEGYAILAKTVMKTYAKLLSEHGYLNEYVADAKIKYAEYDAKKVAEAEQTPRLGNDDAKLEELYKSKNIGADDAVVICSDYDCSGPIIAIGKNVYDVIPSAKKTTDDGWESVAPGKVAIENKPLSQNGPGTKYDLRAYRKEINGCYFLWMDNAYALGDIDGIIKDEHVTIKIKTTATVKSNGLNAAKTLTITIDDNFTSVDKAGPRQIQYVSKDAEGNGYIYRLDKSVASEWNYIESKTEDMYGLKWRKADTFNMFYKISFYDWGHDDDNKGYFRDKDVSKFEWRYGYELYVANDGDNYYLWCRNADKLSGDYLSDRVTLYWPVEKDGKTYMNGTTFFHLVDAENAKLLPKTLVEFK